MLKGWAGRQGAEQVAHLHNTAANAKQTSNKPCILHRRQFLCDAQMLIMKHHQPMADPERAP